MKDCLNHQIRNQNDYAIHRLTLRRPAERTICDATCDLSLLQRKTCSERFSFAEASPERGEHVDPSKFNDLKSVQTDDMTLEFPSRTIVRIHHWLALEGFSLGQIHQSSSNSAHIAPWLGGCGGRQTNRRSD